MATVPHSFVRGIDPQVVVFGGAEEYGEDRGEREVDEIGVGNARGTNEDCMAGRR